MKELLHSLETRLENFLSLITQTQHPTSKVYYITQKYYFVAKEKKGYTNIIDNIIYIMKEKGEENLTKTHSKQQLK